MLSEVKEAMDHETKILSKTIALLEGRTDTSAKSLVADMKDILVDYTAILATVQKLEADSNALQNKSQSLNLEKRIGELLDIDDLEELL